MSQFAARLYTYPVPDAKNIKAVVKEVAKITRPFLTKIYILGAINVSCDTDGNNISKIMFVQES